MGGFDLRQNSAFKRQNNFRGSNASFQGSNSSFQGRKASLQGSNTSFLGSNASFRGSLGQSSSMEDQFGGFGNDGRNQQNFQQRSQLSGQFWSKMQGNAYRASRRRF